MMRGEERVMIGCENDLGLDHNYYRRIEASGGLFTIATGA